MTSTSNTDQPDTPVVTPVLAPVASPVSAPPASEPASKSAAVPAATKLATTAPESSPQPHPKGPKNYKSRYNSTPPPATNCIVLKNLDYNISQMALEEVVRQVTGGRKEFVNIALIEDRVTGSFRGMAFVNFHSTADATAALAELSKMVINKRKVIAEYRRLKPGEKEKKEAYEKRAASRFDHFNGNRQTFEKDITNETDANGNAVDKRMAFFAKRDIVKKVDEQKRAEERAERDKERESEFRAKLLEYKDAETPENENAEELVFDCTLNSHERRKIHMLCEELELGHISRFDDDGSRVLHVTKDPAKKAEWDIATAAQKATIAAKKDENRRRTKEPRNLNPRKNSEPVNGGALSKEELQGIKWFKPRAAHAAEEGNEEAANDGGIRAPSYKLYTPPRQPTGPDGTIGFSSRCRDEDTKTDKSDSTGDTDGPNDDTTQSNEENGGVNRNSDGDTEAEETGEDGDGKQSIKEADGDAEEKSKHTVLNPSVPAFSPSFTPSL